MLRAIKSAYELPTPINDGFEERKRRISSNADDMLIGNTATETTLPWRKRDDEDAARY